MQTCKTGKEFQSGNLRKVVTAVRITQHDGLQILAIHNRICVSMGEERELKWWDI